MKKRVLAFFLCIMICISILPSTVSAAPARDTSFEETLATDLKALGLFKGVSDTNFDLNREPSRIEALVMLVRVLGKEKEALNSSWNHPFTDVPEWADKYVGYAYNKGLTNGVSAKQFGTGIANSGMYLTFVLRALGYSDTNGVDFTWDNPYALAKSIGIFPNIVDSNSFWRADVVIISYAALSVTLKETTQVLAQKLIAAGSFTQTQYASYYDAAAISNYEKAIADAKVELSAEEVYAQCSPAVFYVEVYNSKGIITSTGSGFFIDSNGTAVTNYHVIKDAYSAKVTVSNTGKTYDVLGVYDYSKDEDWAILKIDGLGFPYLDIGASTTIVGGATVYAIGSPLGLQNTISQGLISNPNRFEGNITYIQTSAAISSGSSGGALINKYGDVIGITSATYVDGQNLNLALPISIISGFSSTNLVALSELFPVSESVDGNTRQLAAYSLLRAWVDTYYNTTLGSSNHKAYEETVNQDSTTYIYEIINTDSDEIIIRHLRIIGNEGYTTMLTLLPEGNIFFSSFYYYSSIVSVQHTFKGSSFIYAAGFNNDSAYSFSSYDGYTNNIVSMQSIAKSMLLDSLNFIDYVYYTYMPDFGYYSIADFGFTSIL